MGVGILTLLCCIGVAFAGVCAYCFNWLAKLKEPPDIDIEMKIKKLEL